MSPHALPNRDNWYLDAWDQEREGLRSFAVDRISNARLVEEPARDLPESELNQHLASSYGIFSGEPKGWATIVFSAKTARWVADEQWHSKQQGRSSRRRRTKGRTASRAIDEDILHYGADVRDHRPPVLREQAIIAGGAEQ